METETQDESLEFRLKKLIVEALILEDLKPEDIETEAPLFVEGLGLDSIDALELALAIQMANRAIYERAKREIKLSGMGTTIVSARFTSVTCWCSNFQAYRSRVSTTISSTPAALRRVGSRMPGRVFRVVFALCQKMPSRPPLSVVTTNC